MATASFCAPLGHQVEGQMPLPPLRHRTMSLKPAVSYSSHSRSCWRDVSMHPPATDDNIGGPKSSLLLSFRPTVLSFSSFTYVGRTVPLEPTGSIGTINPFLGILLFCQPCGALDHWSEGKYVSPPVSSSEKDDYTLLGNGPDDVDKDRECNYEECESDYGEDSSSGEEEWEDESDCVTTSDCESVVEFKSSSQPKCQPCLPILSHTFSFSSEESGFCEQLHCEWSEDEDNDDLPDCDFNEGLWHNFERQACFTGIPLKKEKPKTKCVTRPQTRLTIQHSYTSCSSEAKSLRVNTLMCTTYNSNCAAFPSVNKHATVDTDKGSTAATHNHQKRVSFKPDHELVTIHFIIAWKYAYRACRKGPWEQYAADRERFNKRIQTVDSMLAPCLVKKLSYHF